MKYAVIAAALLAPSVAFAQAPQQQTPPNIQALQQTVLKLTGEALDWQTQAITAQRQSEADKATIADLTAKLAAATKTEPPAATSKAAPPAP